MKGSIRMIGGLVMVLAAVGGIDNATNAQMLPLVILSVVGLGAMYSGLKASKTL